MKVLKFSLLVVLLVNRIIAADCNWPWDEPPCECCARVFWLDSPNFPNLNCDDIVNFEDYAILISIWPEPTPQAMRKFAENWLKEMPVCEEVLHVSVFDPTKWYCIHVAWYLSGEGGCEDFGGLTKCCRKGDTILYWLDGYECMIGHGTCTHPTAAAAQKLIWYDGPFDDVFGCVGCRY